MPFSFDTEYYDSWFDTMHDTEIGFSNSRIKSRFDNHDKDGSNEIKTSQMRRPLMKWDLASKNNHPKPQLNSFGKSCSIVNMLVTEFMSYLGNPKD